MRLLILTLFALGCTGAGPDTAAGECVGPDGEIHGPDESFPAEDGCNTCVCRDNGGYACTEMNCP